MNCPDVLIALAILFLTAYLFVQWKFTYWKRRNVPHVPPKFPLGSAQGISSTRNIGEILKIKYMEGRGERFVGIYLILGPVLLIRDPELIKIVLSKDFTSFSARGFNVDSNKDPLSGHLFFLDGPQWRNLRTKLTPAFTSGKMKMMFPIIEQCCNEMDNYLRVRSGQVFEVGDLLARYTTNVVTRCAFGIDVDFFKNPDPMMEKMIHRVGNPTKLDAIKRAIAFSLAQFTKTLPLRLVPKDISDYFIQLVDQMIKERETKNTKKNDFLQILIELKNKGVLDDPDGSVKPSGGEAQAFSFILGGFDTSTGTMEVFLYEIAKHPDVQEQVRNEVLEVIEDGKITYDSLQSMVYLEQVINESLRLHPVVTLLNRECTKPYRLPNSDLYLKPGDKIWISTAGLAADPDFFPEPDKFDPERFSPERKHTIPSYTFMPFGEGPRTCIGNRFAMMQVKAGLAYLLSNFRVSMCEATQFALKRDPKKGLLSILGGVHLKIETL